jgi:deaminated glutathione amidase
MSKLVTACIQMRSGVSPERNVADAERMIREAAARGARLIATPEMTTLLNRAPGATWAAAREEADDASLPAFRRLARELEIDLLIGSMPIRAEAGKCANRSFLVGPDGAITARYDKIHMFDVQLNAGNVYRESESFAAGSHAVLAQLGGGRGDSAETRLGLTVCYDLRFPHLFRDLAKAGAGIIAVPAAFTRITGEAHWHVLLRARAIETGAFLIAPAQGGRHEDGRETFGHSLIVAPWGEIVAELDHAEPGVLVAELDLAQVEAARGKIPALTHDRNYDGPL